MRNEIEELVEAVGKRLSARGERIAVAESCTGGLICSSLVANPDHGGIVERGLIVYSNEAKCDLLGLNRGQVEACDGVSEAIAAEMAKATKRRSGAEWALATTGFAGPRESDEEVGLVYIALASRGGEIRTVDRHYGECGREQVRRRATVAALELLQEEICRLDQ